MTVRAMLLVAALGCGGSSVSEPAEPTQTPPEQAQTFDRFVGVWVSESGAASETWVRVEGAFLGAGFGTSDGVTVLFEALVVRSVDGVSVYTAMPNGRKVVDFPGRFVPSGVVFENAEHDHPKLIEYMQTGDVLDIRLQGDEGELTFQLKRQNAASARVAELEAADRAFDEDNAVRGGAAWAERFEQAGVNWPVGSTRVVGGEAVGARIDAMREEGLELRWSPTASGMSPADDMGFTIGSYRVLERSTGAVKGTGGYLTFWRKTDEGWKIPFDTGVAAEP